MMETTTNISNLLPTEYEVRKKVLDALKVAEQALDKAKQSNTSFSVGEALKKYSTQIQDGVNAVLSKGGVLAQEQLDQLDEQVRMAKLKMLQEESKNTFIRYGTYLGGALVVGALAWFFINKKTVAK